MNLSLIIITGESGAGKSTALKAFEDLGFLAIDNFPIRLLFPFLEEMKVGKMAEKIALVMDLRDSFFLEEIPSTILKLKELNYSFEILFLTAEAKVLITRFSQTRRLHPLLKETKEISQAIELEKKKLGPLKEWATFILDTTNFNVHQLRYEIFKIYGKREDLEKLILHLIAFGYKYGIPFSANYLFDARFLPNPYFVSELKLLSGESKEIKEFLLKDNKTKEFLDWIYNFIAWILPLHKKEGRRFLTIGIGCTGGRHRSPALVQLLAKRLESFKENIEIIVTLRDVEADKD